MRLIAAHTEQHIPPGAVFPNHISVVELADGRVQVSIRGSHYQAPAAAPKITQAQITLGPADWAALLAKLRVPAPQVEVAHGNQ